MLRGLIAILYTALSVPPALDAAGIRLSRAVPALAPLELVQASLARLGLVNFYGKFGKVLVARHLIQVEWREAPAAVEQPPAATQLPHTIPSAAAQNEAGWTPLPAPGAPPAPQAFFLPGRVPALLWALQYTLLPVDAACDSDGAGSKPAVQFQQWPDVYIAMLVALRRR